MRTAIFPENGRRMMSEMMCMCIDAFFTNKFEPEGVSKGSVPKVEAFRKYESSHIN